MSADNTRTVQIKELKRIMAGQPSYRIKLPDGRWVEVEQNLATGISPLHYVDWIDENKKRWRGMLHCDYEVEVTG
jgi:hypothetical protein